MATLRRWRVMPYASLILCIILTAVQFASLPFLFMLEMQSHGDREATALLRVPMVLWFLLPVSSLYGLHLALRLDARESGAAPRVLGINPNALYLLYGIAIWLSLLSGVTL
jgi:hypothetical protein